MRSLTVVHQHFNERKLQKVLLKMQRRCTTFFWNAQLSYFLPRSSRKTERFEIWPHQKQHLKVLLFWMLSRSVKSANMQSASKGRRHKSIVRDGELSETSRKRKSKMLFRKAAVKRPRKPTISLVRRKKELCRSSMNDGCQCVNALLKPVGLG